jgi:hypothetical protein
MKQTIKDILEKVIREDILKNVTIEIKAKLWDKGLTAKDINIDSLLNQATAEMRAKIDDIVEEIMPEFNSFQLNLIIDGLKDLDLNKYDKGYQEVHKHLLARLTK